MKKVVFKRVEGSKELIAVIVNIPGEMGNGSSINISDSLLEKVDSNPIETKTSEIGNRYYKLDEEITLFRVRENEIVIVDTESVKEISKVPFRFQRDNKESRFVVVREVKDAGKNRHNIQIGKVCWDLALGIVEGISRSMVYSYEEKEIHHEKMLCDNRKCSTIPLTSEEHEQKHTNEKGERGAGASHQVIVNIKTMEELEAFIKLIKAY